MQVDGEKSDSSLVQISAILSKLDPGLIRKNNSQLLQVTLNHVVLLTFAGTGFCFANHHFWDSYIDGCSHFFVHEACKS